MVTLMTVAYYEESRSNRIKIKLEQDTGGRVPNSCRFWSPNDRNVKLVSASNRLPVITFNRLGQQQIILEYKIAE
ncbi:unnamed protein product [Haemonchus placei]|uniref:MSP domain-containing protein n=1 Tax=Haemonchus placei TaxID=6290 RepID=A0A0N4WNY6_HAEPC|nr:unnamed protein product [Haemonchus placei]